MTLNEITEQIIGAAIAVHRELGPGLMESTYQKCLARELAVRGLRVETEVGIPIEYIGERLDCGYRVDMLVESAVIVEVKAVRRFDPIHIAQLLTYLKLARCKAGLLINFNVGLLKDGIRRVVR